ncbi:SNF2 helicase associated domain-containing protein [Amedibacterium intestinale]|uniref:SNF2 helicase associated domain-containing protein n=1 Tax=Amedibacterium intestinale TaxID=2583452 RepID=UPI000E493256|nr:SNF2 helicase associated domain-containing protein [Amedibacterium intestinale]RHO24593.1 calcium-binding protein [Eubacterium sp. AM18-26]RHO28833.1 calcium-binding protein [Eubacterium sp. AM18-10LB-B]BBK62605.1 helicase [Amedibacterium intestinale]
MEITDVQIREFAHNDTILKEGEELWKNNAVVSFDFDDFSNPDIILINANVKDEKGYQEVNMSIDKDDVIIRAHLCNCKQHSEQLSCRHCVAVLYKVKEILEKKYPSKQEHTGDDATLVQLLETYEKQNVYASLAYTFQEKMHLEPVIEIHDHSFLALTLKIGTNYRYIIKNISQLIDDIQEHVTKAYGKELEFFHHYDSFDEESQKLLDFIISHMHDSVYIKKENTSQACLKNKSLLLTPDALDSFFNLYAGKEIMYRFKEKTLTNLHFVKTNPSFTLDVKENRSTDSFSFRIEEKDNVILEGRKHLYVLRKGFLYQSTPSFYINMHPLIQSFYYAKKELSVSKQLMPSFYTNILLNIKEYIQIQGDDISLYAPMPLECKAYLDMPKHNCISVKLIYSYGKMEYNAFLQPLLSSGRNIKEEMAVRSLLSRYITRIDTNEGIVYIENSQDAMYTFITQGVDELTKKCIMYATEAFSRMQVRSSTSISMGIRMESDLLHIDFDTYDFPKEELQNVLEAYRLNRKYYRMKDGSFVSLEDNALQELSLLLDGMNVSASQLENGNLIVPKYRSLYIDKSLEDADMMKIDRDASFKDIIRGIHNIKDADYPVPPNQKHILRNYQKIGYRWLKTMANYGFGGILADDMGIGKTIQVITLLEDERIQHPESVSLVICPSSLLLNWQSEIQKFSKDLSCIMISGTSEERKRQIQNCKSYDVVITSYDYIKRDIEQYEDVLFTYQILDEAQYIKNHTTKNATSVKQIQAKHRFALTGTPIENSLAELWSIFDYLMPGYLYSYPYFKKHYEFPIVKENDPATVKELQRMVEPFILRRVKKDVLKELPEKIEKTMMIELDEETRKLYMANVNSMKEDLRKNLNEKGVAASRILVLTMLTRLRQLCCDPRLVYENYAMVGNKINACMEYIETCYESGKKVLLFSQFTSLLSLLEEELHKRNIRYYLLKGSTPKDKRQEYVNAFQNDNTPVFLISLKAGGTGLNLTKAEVVIHFDPWWNISAQNQATDRAYRIGQHNNVQVIKMIAKDTIEEKIMKLQDKKQSLSDTIIQQNEGIITQMSKEEILDLF